MHHKTGLSSQSHRPPVMDAANFSVQPQVVLRQSYHMQTKTYAKHKNDEKNEVNENEFYSQGLVTEVMTLYDTLSHASPSTEVY